MSDCAKKYVRRQRFYDVFKDRHFLRHLDIELTERCNQRCIHCYINQRLNDRQIANAEMGTQKILDIIDEAAALGCLRMRLTGGEPLVRDDFEDIYLHIRRLGIKVILSTNATLLTTRYAKLLARVPPLEPVEVSMYGLSRTSYEDVSLAPGSFDAAKTGLQLLKDYNVPYVTKASLLPPNLTERAAYERREDGPHGSRPLNIYFNLRARRDNPVKNSIIKTMRYNPEKIVELKKTDFNDEKQRRLLLESISGPCGDFLFVCSAGENSGCVDAYGRLQMCTLLRHPDYVFDLNSGPLRQGLEFLSQKRRQKAQSLNYKRRCARCFIRRLCEMCPARSWMEYGDIDRPVDYYCLVAHAQARYLGLLEADEWAWQVGDWVDRVNRVSKTFVGGTV